MKDTIIAVVTIIGTIALCSVAYLLIIKGASKVAQYNNTASVSSGATSTLEQNATSNVSTSTNLNEAPLDFTIDFPSPPQKQIQHLAQGNISTYTLATADAFYKVEKIDLNVPLVTPGEGEVRAYIAKVAQAQQGQVINTELQSIPIGAHFVVRGSNRMIFYNYLEIHPSTIYVISYKCDATACDSATYNHFISSFRIGR